MAWQAASASSEGFGRRRPLSGQPVWLIVRRRARLAGLQGDFGAHSLQSGFVTEAGRQNVHMKGGHGPHRASQCSHFFALLSDRYGAADASGQLTHGHRYRGLNPGAASRAAQRHRQSTGSRITRLPSSPRERWRVKYIPALDEMRCRRHTNASRQSDQWFNLPLSLHRFSVWGLVALGTLYSVIALVIREDIND